MAKKIKQRINMGGTLIKNDIIEVEIVSLDYKGDGVAKVDGKPIFIRGGLTGERVRAKIILVKKTFYVGLLMQIISTSNKRVKPKCKVFSKCGGCDLQHLDYASQLEFKLTAVANTFKSVCGNAYTIDGIVGSDEIYAYRNKLSLPVRNVGGAVKIGFFANASHRLVETAECPLQNKVLDLILPVFTSWVADKSAYDEESGLGDIRHLVIRKTGDMHAVTVVSQYVIDLSGLSIELEKLGIAFALYLNINMGKSNVILGERTMLVYGAEQKSNVMGMNVFVHPLAFLQVNEGVAEKIYSHACEIINKGNVLDAYCGGGLLSAKLASSASHVLGVEINKQAVDSAKVLIEDNNITNAEFICGDCGQELPKLSGAKFDAVVLDPPRQGCDESVLSAVNEFGAKSIVYISCNPATLARDIQRLTNYEVSNITLYDMFPQTKHVETLAHLSIKA